MANKIFGLSAVTLVLAAKLASNVNAMWLSIIMIGFAILAGFASGYIQKFIHEVKEAMYE